MKTINRNYRIKNLGRRPAKFGRCDVCLGNAAVVFYQQEERLVEIGGNEYWTLDGCQDWFGHEKCLESVRTAPYTINQNNA